MMALESIPVNFFFLVWHYPAKLDLISCNEKLDIVFSKSNRAKIKPKKNIKLDTIKNIFPL
jgi:hypothetical protein